VAEDEVLDMDEELYRLRSDFPDSVKRLPMCVLIDAIF